MDKKTKLKEVLDTSERCSSVVVLDPNNKLLATPMNDSSIEAANYLYGNCEVIRDNTVDRHRAIRINTSKKRKVFA